MSEQTRSAAPSTPASPPRRVSTRTSTRSRPSARPVRPISARRRMKAGSCIPDRFDDGGFSGGNMERPALAQLMEQVRDGKVDIIVIYKIDRLTRSLTDFARLAETFDKHRVSFVSVTQQFNTTTSMGRLMLNVLLSFAQFEREITGERIRDKIAAIQEEGHVDGWHCPHGLRRRRPAACHQPG